MVTSSGKQIPAEIHATHIRFGDAEYACAYINDISVRKRAQAERLESQRRLQTLIDNLPGIAYRCRFDSSYTMEFISDGCQDLTGYSADDLIGNAKLSYAQIIHPDDQQSVWESIQPAIHGRYPYELNYRIVTASGEIKWIWEQGQAVYGETGEIIALEGLINDVTESHHYQEALLDSEQHLRSVLEQSPFGIAVFEPNGTYRQFNHVWSDIFRIEQEAVSLVLEQYS